MNEQAILDAIYKLYEGDNELWDTASDEYLTSRAYANDAVNFWEFYLSTKWRDLFTNLSDAVDGVKTIGSSYSVSCPSNFRYPASYVSIGGTVYDVIGVEKLATYKNSGSQWVYFSGNIKDGYKLNINPNLTLVAGNTIEYQYYKQATKFTAITSVTEMPDPYYIVYYVLKRLYINDGETELAGEAKGNADARIDSMYTQNLSGLFGVENTFSEPLTNNDGFGV